MLQRDLFYYREGNRFPPPGRETMNRFFLKGLADHAPGAESRLSCA
jgi:hypothetical protein